MCTNCEMFENGSVHMYGYDETARLVMCGFCHQYYFRPNQESYHWTPVSTQAELFEHLQTVFATVQV